MTEDTALHQPADEQSSTIEALEFMPSSRKLTRVLSLAGMILWPLGFGIVVVGLWEVLNVTNTINPVVLPGPLSVAKTIGQVITTGGLWSNLWVTVQEALIGWTIGSTAAFLVGVAIALSKRASRALYPYVVVFQAMPHIVLVPIFIVAFGFGVTSRIVMATILSFFPVVVNTIAGFVQVDELFLLLFRSFDASRSSTIHRLLFPNSLPFVMAGLKTSLTLAFVGAVVAELQAGVLGIGVLVTAATTQINMPEAFSYIFVLAMVTATFYLIFNWLETRIIFWREQVRRTYKT